MLIILSVVASILAAVRATSPTVTLASGVVVGTATSLPSARVSVNKYYGIPFARSPPERFSLPEDPAPWTGNYNASIAKPLCLQQFNYPKMSRPRVMQIFNEPGGPANRLESEDCLYVNVFTPSLTSSSPRAVMVFFYGGALQFGDAAMNMYDGTFFATNQDIIIVTFGFRGNVFGFPNSPELPKSKQNLGLHDQRKALDWIQANIAAFGGDPAKVTLFGQSSGASSVKQLLALPPKPLNFRAAILESEGAESGDPGWEKLAQKLNCSSAPSPLQCVRAAPATTIIDTIEQTQLSFFPVVDNVTWITTSDSVFETRQAAPVPFIIGSTADEGRPFAYIEGLDSPTTDTNFTLNSIFPNQPVLHETILLAYSTSAKLAASPYHLISRVLTDVAFHCPTAKFSALASEAGYAVWRYHYNATFSNQDLFPDPGAFHSCELPQVFGTYDTFGPPTQAQIQLSKDIQGKWAKFAKDPNSGPGWPRLGTNGGVELADFRADNAVVGEVTIAQTGLDKLCPIYDTVTLALGL